MNGVVTTYTLHGKNVVHMSRGSDQLHFFYDAQNRPAVVVYNGTAYAYVKNLQGDIIGILDNTGAVVVNYTYDAWGMPTSIGGNMASTLGEINPFRYRGYVYDPETGMYYLRSRYYSPNTVRFINADALLTPNLYTYCVNTPVVAFDKNGYDWNEIGFDPEANDIQFMQEVYPKIMSYMRIALDYCYPGKNKKYDDTRIAHRLATYNRAGKLVTQGVTDCSHLTYEVTDAGSTTSPMRYSEVLDKYKGALFADGELAVELCRGMEVYNASTGHVGILLLYTLDEEIGEEWCVAQSTSEIITNSRALFESDPHRGPNITSFYTKDGTAPTWHYYTMPRYWKDLTQP